MNDQELGAAVEKWISDAPRFARRAARWAMASYHHRLPRHMRPWAILHLLSKTAAACSAPFVAYVVYQTITAWMAGIAAALIVLLQAAVGFFDRLSKERSSPQQHDQTEAIVRIGDLLGLCAPASKQQTIRDDMVRSALGIIENFARQVTHSKKGEISVSTALYQGNSNSRMHIRHRNPGNTRPVNRNFDGRAVLGHHACQAGDSPKIVHNLKRMNRIFRTSPTRSEVIYQSFLIIPLNIDRNGRTTIGGFLSIDATRPYTFYGNRGTQLIVNCQPVVEHIQRLL